MVITILENFKNFKFPPTSYSENFDYEFIFIGNVLYLITTSDIKKLSSFEESLKFIDFHFSLIVIVIVSSGLFCTGGVDYLFYDWVIGLEIIARILVFVI